MIYYLDHAATTQPSNFVRSRVLDTQKKYWANPNSLHKLGIECKSQLKEAEHKVLDFLKVSNGEIIWTFGGSDANNRIVQSLVSKPIEIVTYETEHKSIAQYYTKNFIHFSTKLVSQMYVNNETGEKNLIHYAAKCAKEINPDLIFHSDFTATIGKISNLELDISDIDAVTLSGHKVYGPKGVGCLWIKNPETANKIRNHMYYGTPNTEAIIGFSEALSRLDVDQEINLTRDQSEAFQRGLKELGRWQIQLWPTNYSSILPIYFEDIDAMELVMELSDRGVMCSHGSACSLKESTRVLEAAGLEKEVANSTVRFSFGQLITVNQCKEAAKIIKQTVEELRNERS